jgi:hypothetical protein
VIKKLQVVRRPLATLLFNNRKELFVRFWLKIHIMLNDVKKKNQYVVFFPPILFENPCGD